MKTWHKVAVIAGLGPIGVGIVGVNSCIELNKQLDDFTKENQRIKVMLTNDTFPRKACPIDPTFRTI